MSQNPGSQYSPPAHKLGLSAKLYGDTAHWRSMTGMTADSSESAHGQVAIMLYSYHGKHCLIIEHA